MTENDLIDFIEAQLGAQGPLDGVRPRDTAQRLVAALVDAHPALLANSTRLAEYEQSARQAGRERDEAITLLREGSSAHAATSAEATRWKRRANAVTHLLLDLVEDGALKLVAGDAD